MSTNAILEALVAASRNAPAALMIKATLAMLAALLLLRLTARASAALRHLVAAAAFGALLLLPLAALLVPARVMTVPAAAPAAAAPAAAEPERGATPTSAAASAAATVAPPVTASPRPLDLARIALGGYLAGVAACAAVPLLGLWRMRGVRRAAEVSVPGTRLANDMARELGLDGGIEVAVSQELAVPLTFGWTEPVILLPAEADEWDEAERGRALRHELEHIARGDWAAHLLARAALALYWAHPAAWALWRRLRLEAERACDDAVIRSQGQPVPYAEQLVALARRLSGRGAVPALSMAARSHLGLRVESILDRRRPRTPRSRLASLAVTAAALAAVLAIAPLRVIGAVGPLPAAALDDRREKHHDDDDDDDPGRDSRDEALFNAARRGDREGVRRLLDQGAKADAVLYGDGTPLLAAARGGHLEIMETLIAAGADVNRGVEGDGNALTAAAKRGQLEAVRLLLDRGADVDRGVPGDGNALIMAAGEGRLEVMGYLLEHGAGIEQVVPGDENPLIKACESGELGAAKLLLSRGANVNARVWSDTDERGRGEWRTPLLMARRNGHTELVKLLRAAGAQE
ncbi:MAG TPA: ankyrin repeat domain-containing protein [Vicinamibacteria bacterium]